MPQPNKDRLLVSLLSEIAAEQGMQVSSFSHDWILRLEKDGLVRHIFGYNFELNSATAQLLAGDKAAIADLLADRGVPHVEHRLFLHPQLGGYVSADGNWPAMLAYVERTGFPLVVKPNNGTGGEGVARVDTLAELEKNVVTLFRKYRAVCFSPFLEIEQEYRVLVLDDACELIYSKRRPHLLGDGSSTLVELIEQQLLAGNISQPQASAALEQHRGGLRQVPPAGQEILVGWKHNLGEGSAPQLLPAGDLRSRLAALAANAQRAIGIRFASIDIVDVAGSLAVLEINSGVMMEHFARRLPEGRQMAKDIYARAVARMFAPR